jgi:ferredoxin-type protein NapH
MTLVASAVTGTIAWEMVNPITMLFRGLVFGLGFAWAVVLAVFLFDLFVSRRGWCGHLCPVGAAYSIIGIPSVLKVSAARRDACTDCMDCYAVCPEPQVIRPALKGAERGAGPIIQSPNCTNCGRCIDVCVPDVFVFTNRFNTRTEESPRMREAA